MKGDNPTTERDVVCEHPVADQQSEVIGELEEEGYNLAGGESDCDSDNESTNDTSASTVEVMDVSLNC